MLFACAVAVNAYSQPRPDRRLQVRIDEARRIEGQALINLADGAMSGHAASDFAIQWTNDFFKAEAGTFVPFTLTMEGAELTAAKALLYVRAVRRDAAIPGAAGGDARYPFDIIFPIDIEATTARVRRITRGFAVPPGEYDVYVAIRERAADPLSVAERLKAAVLKQPLSVPVFWPGELSPSPVMRADRTAALREPIAPEDVLERPYVIGDNEVHRAFSSVFPRTAELIVVFLIYSPAVTAEKSFDIQVDYHVFRRGAARAAAVPTSRDEHPPARDGEGYVTRTDPQRFTPVSMGTRFDPSAGQPLLAGQGILLSSFQEGEYRLGITVTDMTSRKTLSRDVTFTVAGS